jgi:hypothetical protein
MPERSSIPKDAVSGVASSDQPSETPKNPHAVALGRIGGLKGGAARAEKLTPERRSEIARRAAEARWATKGRKADGR